MQEFSGCVTLHHGDCRDVLKSLPDNSIDAVPCDPPYELNFMGKGWDDTGIANDPALWAEVFRVLKPGGHIAAFSASRTYHRMACAIEDAGFEIRDSLMWIYGTGFPKSHDVSKGIDRAAGSVRELTRPGVVKRDGYGEDWDTGSSSERPRYDVAATDSAREWQGWGTALKPAFEPIVLARKPLSEKTVAANVLRWGTGAINIDGCRVEGESTIRTSNAGTNGDGWGMGRSAHVNGSDTGRWPANVVHDGSDEVVGMFPHTTSGAGGGGSIKTGLRGNTFEPKTTCGRVGGSGSAARFFYSAKASKLDRAGSKHPTVKPIKLMQWLARLITPPGGTILDPFAGSGTTGAAATAEGFKAVLIEREAEYCDDIKRRLAVAEPAQLAMV